MNRFLILLLALFALARSDAAQFRAGTARVDITPDYPIRLSGYASRKTESEGVGLRIFTKSLAISQNDGETALMITVDNVGISKEIRDEIVGRIQKEHGIPPERIVIFSSHTHSAPFLKDAI